MTHSSDIHCPGCGAELTLAHRSVEVVICDYCSGVVSLTERGPASRGKAVKLAGFPSLLATGARGRLKGRSFQAPGRVRFEYDEGFWDEWYLLFEDGAERWLHEDEGEFVLFHKEPCPAGLPAFASVRVGQNLLLGGRPVFVTEKRSARVAGTEGQLRHALFAGENLDFFDGQSGGAPVSIEYTRVPSLALGEPVEPEEISVEVADD